VADDSGGIVIGGRGSSWHWRCWGTYHCDGWVGVDLGSRNAAQREADRHVREQHAPTAGTEEQDR
jgi:hypothetical protein